MRTDETTGAICAISIAFTSLRRQPGGAPPEERLTVEAYRARAIYLSARQIPGAVTPYALHLLTT
jgi:hypothetical protein